MHMVDACYYSVSRITHTLASARVPVLTYASPTACTAASG